MEHKGYRHQKCNIIKTGGGKEPSSFSMFIGGYKMATEALVSLLSSGYVEYENEFNNWNSGVHKPRKWIGY
jgi:hypothetical protein